MVRHEVENQVVLLSTLGEIFASVINDVIGADGSDHGNVPGTAHASNFRAERLRDLHSEGTHASRSTDDQDLLPRLKLPLVAQALQSGESRQGYSSHLFKRRVSRFHDQGRLGNTGILGKGPAAQAEDRVARLELRYLAADCCGPLRDNARHITPGSGALSFA